MRRRPAWRRWPGHWRLPAWLRRWSRRLFGWQSLLRLFLLALTIGISFATWLVTTEAGARLAIGWTSAITPNLRVQHESGTLVGPLQLQSLRIRGKNRVDIDHLRIDWAPSSLFTGELHLLAVDIDTVRLQQPPATARKPGGTPVSLPTLDLPLDLRVDRLRIAQFEQQRGERRSLFRDIELAGDWRDALLRIKRLQFAGPRWQARADGEITTRSDWPSTSNLHFGYPSLDTALFAIDGHAGGPLAGALAVELTTRGQLDSQVAGTLRPLQPGMPFAAQLQAAHARIPPSAGDDRAATLAQLALQGSGEVTGNFSISGSARLDTPWSEPVPAGLRAEGTWRGLERLAVDIDDPQLKATLVTDYRWLDGQQFAGRVALRHLDLALINPALHSTLAGNLRIHGEIPPATATGKRMRVDVQIDEIQGDALGRQQVQLRGPLYWQDGQWHLDGLALHQQNNLAVLHGTVGSQWNANAMLTLPQLDGLLPGFSGRATGSAQLSGKPADPHFALRLELQQLLLPEIALPAPLSRPLHLPPVNWSLVGDARLHDIDILEAHTVDAPFSVLARGPVSWRDTLDWDLKLQYADLPLAELVDDLFFPRGHGDGLVSGTLDTRGSMGKSLATLAIDLQANGQLAGEKLDAGGHLDWQPARIAVEKLRLVHGNNRLLLDGLLDDTNMDVSGSVDAPELADSLREVSGRLQASAAVHGKRQAPDVQVELAASSMAHGHWSLGRVDGRLQLARGGEDASQLELRANNLQLQQTGKDLPAIDGLQLSAQGTRGQHRLSFAGSSGALALAVNTHGGADDRVWRGRLDGGSVDIDDWHWESRGEPPLAVQFAGGQLAIDPHCWSDGSARICFLSPIALGRSGQLALEAFHLPLQKLLPLSLPLDTRIDGTLGGLLQARWNAGELRQLDIDIRNGTPLEVIEEDDDSRERRLAKIDSLQLGAQLADGHWQAHADARGDETGEIAATLAMARDEQLSGRLEIHSLKPDLLNAFLYQVHNVGGTLAATLELAGTCHAPQLHGGLSLRDGRFAFTRLPLAVEQLQIDGRVDGNQLRLNGSFLTPESRTPATVGGDFRLVDGHWLGQARLSGHKLQVGRQPEYRFSLSPELSLELAPGELAITGDVNVPDGRVAMKKLPVQSVKLSPDVVNVHEELPAEGQTFGIRQRVDMNILLGDDIYFVALGGEGRLTGNLRLRSTPLLPMRLDGELYVKDGKYRAFGQDLAVRRGVVLFNGPPDRPLVEALAVREVNDPAVREVGVQLSGSLLAPQTTLWSPNDLPPEQTLAWLTTGQAPTTGPGNLNDEAAQAALSMGLAQGSVLLSEVGQEIGLRDVQLSSTGAGEDSEMQVGTHVSDRVFVGYNQRVFTGESSVLMRLQLSRKLMVEALSGIESAVDIFYIFEF